MHKVGIIGSRAVAEAHIKSIQKLSCFQLSGIYDFDEEERLRLHEEFQIPVFKSIDDLINQSDIVDIASEDMPHFDIASQAVRKSCHVFIDRPLVSSLPEAQKLIELAFEADVKVQIGHMERFNPAFVLASEYIQQPNYIEARRTQTLDNSRQHVVLDMMIQDIDIILSIANSGIKKIQARGHSLHSDELLMVNAHIVFDNGCIANLTSSKMDTNASTSLNIFQENDSLHIDLLNNRVQHHALNAISGTQKAYLLQNKETCKPLELELESFNNSIKNNTTPNVSLMDGSQALEVALLILDRVAYWQDVKFEGQKFGLRI